MTDVELAAISKFVEKHLTIEEVETIVRLIDENPALAKFISLVSGGMI